MELSKEQQRRIQNLIDKCNKFEDDSLDIYEVMNTYKCYLNASDEVRDYIYEVVVGALYGEPTPKVYGYARVSTKSQEDNTSLENQVQILKSNGCIEIYTEVHTGATMNRPKFMELEKKLKRGDTLIITKLDRFTRSTELGIAKIKELVENGIKVNILNMGIVDLTSAMGKMMFTVLSAFAEYEKDCIVERMKEGKEVAKERAKERGEKFKEGRPKAHSQENIDRALKLLETMSYREVVELTKISKSTLIRAKRERGLI